MIGAFEGEWGYVGHELLAGSSHTRRHRSREHHDLLLARGCFEDLLHSLPHVDLREDLIAFVDDKEVHMTDVQCLVFHESKQPPWCGTHDVRS